MLLHLGEKENKYTYVTSTQKKQWTFGINSLIFQMTCSHFDDSLTSLLACSPKIWQAPRPIWILAPDLSRWIMWPRYWPLIGWDMTLKHKTQSQLNIIRLSQATQHQGFIFFKTSFTLIFTFYMFKLSLSYIPNTFFSKLSLKIAYCWWH